MNALLRELEELFDKENSRFLFTQPAIRSVFGKVVAVLNGQESRIRELERRFEDTEG